LYEVKDPAEKTGFRFFPMRKHLALIVEKCRTGIFDVFLCKAEKRQKLAVRPFSANIY